MTAWKSDGDWHYDFFPLDMAEESFPGFESIFRRWRTKSDSLPPSWSDFDFLDFREWWGWLSVYDAVEGQPLAFDVRLWGTEIVEVTGHDPTGRRLSPENLPDKSDPTAVSLNSIKFARFLLDESFIGVTSEPYREDWGPAKLFKEILLPQSSDGNENDKILFAGQIVNS
ncbi:MAG: hypothetical protein QF521_01940 [Alphaproteobacteria bacterium]|nr:hypothetical protein [Alphaproteobacteria bacterium]